MEGILSSAELEDGVLEVDGRVTRADIHSMTTSLTTSAPNDPDAVAALHSIRAAKAITVWRWQDEMADDIGMQMVLSRGGRQALTTVHFLRNA